MSKRSLGFLVRQTRQSKGLTQYALAKDAGISTPYLQRLESGEYDRFPPELLVSVARVLGLAPETLADELEKGTPPKTSVEAGAPATEGSPTGSAPAPRGRHLTPVDSPNQGEPLLSLVPLVDPERLMQDIALLPDEDQALVADFVQMLLRRRRQ